MHLLSIYSFMPSCYNVTYDTGKAEYSSKHWIESIDDNNVKNMSMLTLIFHLVTVKSLK